MSNGWVPVDLGGVPEAALLVKVYGGRDRWWNPMRVGNAGDGEVGIGSVQFGISDQLILVDRQCFGC